MKKYFIGATILAVSSIVNAVPNLWENHSIKGYDVYKISSSDNKILRVMCNSASSTNFIHLIEFDINEKTYPHTNLSFVIDETEVITPTIDTITYTDSEHWYKLTSAFADANKIEVYYKDKLETTIYPQNPQLTYDLKNCPSMLERKLQEQSEEEGKEYIPSCPLA